MLSLLFKYKSIIAGGIAILGLIIGFKLYLNSVYERGVLDERNRILLENKEKQIESNKITSDIQINLSKSTDEQRRELEDIESELNKVRLEHAKRDNEESVILTEDELLEKLADINKKVGNSPSFNKEIEKTPVKEVGSNKIQYVLVPVEQKEEIARAEIKALWDTFCIQEHSACK